MKMGDVAEKPVVEVINGKGAEDDAVSATKTDEATGKKDECAKGTVAAEDADAENPKEDTATDNDDLSKSERAIIRQIEYYFGDNNLNRDKFLIEQIKKDEEGWVPFSVLLTFKRLSALSTDPEAIISSLMKSDDNLVEISEDHLKIRRHPERPIPEHNNERRTEIQTRTVYVKGFPLDADISTLIDYFAPYEKVVNVIMRKYSDKATKTYKFKGSVFVTFATKEQAQDFVEKDKVLFEERELLRKWQQKYFEDKRQEAAAKKAKVKVSKQNQEEHKIELPKGTVVAFTGADDSVTRETLREAVEAIEGDWNIAFISFNKGDKEGQIRFHNENEGVKFLEQLTDKKLKLKDDVEITLNAPTEEEEKAFLDKAVEHMMSRRQPQNKYRGNRKRFNRGDNRHDHKKKKAHE